MGSKFKPLVHRISAEGSRAVLVLSLATLLPLSSWAAEQSASALAAKVEAADRDTRREATYQLSRMGSAAKEALPALIKALGDDDKQVWSNAIAAIAGLGPAAESAIPTLLEGMDGRKKSGGRRQYDRQQILLRNAFALSQIGPVAIAPLTEGLNSEDSGLRIGCAKALGMMGESASSVVPALLAKVGDGEEELRKEVVEALGGIGAPAVKPLIETLGSQTPRVREGACLALAQVGRPAQPASTQLLAIADKDADPAARSAALRSLSPVGADPAKATPILLTGVRDADERTRHAATNALLTSRAFSERAVPALVADLKSADQAGRTRAALVLGRMGPSAHDAVPALIEIARKSPDDPSFGNALAQIGEPSLDPLLKELTSTAEKDPVKKAWAFRALRDIGAPAMASLVSALDAKEPVVRAGAARALEGMPLTPQVTKRLVELSEDSDPNVRASTLRTLATVRSQRDTIVPKLEAGLQAKESEVRRAAAAALAGLGAVAKIGPDGLVELLQEPEFATRRAAIEALGTLGETSAVAVPALIEKTNDPALQGLAVETLGKIGPKAAPAVPKLVEIAKAPNEELRFTALQALGNIGEGLDQVLPLLYDGLKSQNRDLRIAAMLVLPKVEKDDAKLIEALKSGLQDESGRVRRGAVDATKKMHERGAPLAPILFTLLDREPERPGALAALREVGVKDVPPLLKALNHRDATVRAFACDSLGKLGPAAQEAVPVLQQKAEGDSDVVKAAAKKALEKIGVPPAAAAATKSS